MSSRPHWLFHDNQLNLPPFDSRTDICQVPIRHNHRAMTRNPLSAKARALAARGAEIVKADLDLLYTLSSAFKNVHAIFAISDF